MNKLKIIVHTHTIIKHIYCINLNICRAHSCNSNESSGTMKENSWCSSTCRKCVCVTGYLHLTTWLIYEWGHPVILLPSALFVQFINTRFSMLLGIDQLLPSLLLCSTEQLTINYSAKSCHFVFRIVNVLHQCQNHGASLFFMRSRFHAAKIMFVSGIFWVSSKNM